MIWILLAVSIIFIFHAGLTGYIYWRQFYRRPRSTRNERELIQKHPANPAVSFITGITMFVSGYAFAQLRAAEYPVLCVVGLSAGVIIGFVFMLVYIVPFVRDVLKSPTITIKPFDYLTMLVFSKVASFILTFCLGGVLSILAGAVFHT